MNGVNRDIYFPKVRMQSRKGCTHQSAHARKGGDWVQDDTASLSACGIVH